MGNLVCLESQSNPPQIAILLVGQSGVGKTKIINKLKKCNSQIKTTEKMQRHSVQLNKAELLLIDSPGNQDHFAESISKFTIRHIQAIIYVGEEIDQEKKQLIEQLSFGDSVKTFTHNPEKEDSKKFFLDLIEQLI